MTAPAEGGGPWLAAHRVTVPEPVDGHVQRTALVDRCMPTRRPLTLVQAPAGFGKTTVLAECCRVLAAEGVPVAWLALSEDDDPLRLYAYLAQAFWRGGLDGREPSSVLPTAWQGSRHGVTRLLHAVDAHGGPCVLALDDVDRLTNPESIGFLKGLVRSSIPNLHVMLTCRDLPAGLDLRGLVSAGDGVLLAAEDLRFSRKDTVRLFGGTLSDEELAAVVADSAGWPMALRIRRAMVTGSTSRARVVRELAGNWVQSSLWGAFGEDERGFLLDVGLLEWIDAELLDEALVGTGMIDKLERMPGMRDLMEPVRGGGASVWRLPRVIREHCVDRRRRETPDRYRAINLRIAGVLARRGETLDAMRHAIEAGDSLLAGRILMHAGGLELWLRDGAEQLVVADRFLTEETVAADERLALVRAAAHTLRGSVADAGRRFEAAVQRLMTEGPGVNPALDIDRCFLWGMLTSYGVESLGSQMAPWMIAETRRIAETPSTEAVAVSTMEYVLCLVHGLKGEFDRALAWGARAGQRLEGERLAYLRTLLDLEYGQIAMAQGQVRDAVDSYEDCASVALDSRVAVISALFAQELDLERNMAAESSDAHTVPSLQPGSVPFAAYAAVSGAAVELALHLRGVDAALSVVDEMWEDAQRAQLEAVIRYLEGHRVGILAAGGRVGEAEAQWRTGQLPQSLDGCLDLAGQSWREMEVLSCARLRLLIACGDFESARWLAHDLIGVTAGRGLRRTWMRVLILAVALEEAVGNRAAARRHLTAFLELFSESDYAWAVVRERGATVPVLRDIVDAGPRSSLHASARALLVATGAVGLA